MEFPIKIYSGSHYKIIHNELELEKEKAVYTFIEAAGGIVLDEHQRVLLIRRNGIWDLPKGKAEFGESRSVTALREVQEETGIRCLKLCMELPSTFHTYFQNGHPVLKQTYWFSMLASANEVLSPQIEENITDVCWIPLPKALSNLQDSYPSLYELITIFISSLSS